jgi:ABC-2 type transport system ATP-binding protein
MSDKKVVVEVNDVSKTFHIPLEASNGIKQKLINHIKGRKGYREFSPLNGISFAIEKGDFFGIVGRNGSGKSTLLKTIAGIYSPTKGNVHVDGSLVPFIELGVGFNPELTGRENVYLNGALLGFSRNEMEDMYDDIVEFAELNEFIDERLKNYSSGMQVRLAFSIAIRAEGDILLLDEVLAVGDEAFQRKCFSYFERLKRNKKTVILVTHDMASVERFCTKAMMIEEGHIKVIGSPREVAIAYSRSNDDNYNPIEIETEAATEEQVLETYGLTIDTKDTAGVKRKKFTAGDSMVVDMKWDNPEVSDASITVTRESGEVIFGAGTYQDSYTLKRKNHLSFTVDLNLAEGVYYLKVGLGRKDDPTPVVLLEEGPHFVVSRNKDDARWDGLTKLNHTWES